MLELRLSGTVDDDDDDDVGLIIYIYSVINIMHSVIGLLKIKMDLLVYFHSASSLLHAENWLCIWCNVGCFIL
jgi:hypothetical protein